MTGTTLEIYPIEINNTMRVYATVMLMFYSGIRIYFWYTTIACRSSVVRHALIELPVDRSVNLRQSKTAPAGVGHACAQGPYAPKVLYCVLIGLATVLVAGVAPVDRLTMRPVPQMARRRSRRGALEVTMATLTPLIAARLGSRR
jgi:hypothetical protein